MSLKHDWTSLMSEMDRYVPDHIIDRGCEYYEQGLVEEVRIEQPWIHATVLGNYGDYNVKVNRSDFSKSRCDCPYEGYCKHMAAVVYYVTRQYSDDFGGETDESCTNHITGKTKSSPDQAQLQPSSEDAVLLQLQSQGQQDLLAILETLMHADPTLRESVRLLLVERERTASMNSDRMRDMDLYSSLAYYQKEVPSVLQECESLFIERTTDYDDEVEDDDWKYGYTDDDEDEKEWDYAAGLERLHRFGQELLKIVTPAYYISGTVGLMVTVIELRKWIERYVNEYGGSEMEDGCFEFEAFLQEALERVKRYQESNPDAQTFLRELVDWIVGQCKQLDDLLEWTSIVAHCIADLPGLWHLKERIGCLDKDFLHSGRFQHERHRRILTYWWVELSLSLDHEEEAKRAAGTPDDSYPFDPSIAHCFVRYYERRGMWQEVMASMRTILESSAFVNQQDYERMVRFCKLANDEAGKKVWLEKWLLAFPDMNLFKRNASLLEGEPDQEARIVTWIDAIAGKRKYALVIEVYLFLNKLEQAWTEFSKRKGHFLMNEPVLLKLFKEMKKHDPTRLIPLYRDLVLKHIGYRNRSGYAMAARWMKDLKEVCIRCGKEDVWNGFYREIMTEYRRFRSLMEEIRTAGI